MLRVVRIISGEFDGVIRLLEIIKQHCVVDAQARKADHMNERQAALFQPTGELARHVFLVRAGQGKDHPPMATLKIALPHAAAFPLEQMFLRATEAEEIRAAWNNDLTV